MFLRNKIKTGKTRIAQWGKGFPGGLIEWNLEPKVMLWLEGFTELLKLIFCISPFEKLRKIRHKG